MDDHTADPAAQARRRSALGTLLIMGALLGYTLLATPPAASHALAPPSAALKLNPNTATRAELMLLPRIGPALADNIMRFRASADRQPAFHDAADLDQVDRIGPATVAQLAPHLAFEPPAGRIDR